MIPFKAICATCSQGFEVRFERAADITLLAQLSKEGQLACRCPRSCGGELKPTEVLSAPWLSVTVTELYQSVFGMALPDEVPKSGVVVSSLLKAERIVGADVEEDSDSKAIYLRALHLSNGCTIHLCSSGKGPQVLKITRSQ